MNENGRKNKDVAYKARRVGGMCVIALPFECMGKLYNRRTTNNNKLICFEEIGE